MVRLSALRGLSGQRPALWCRDEVRSRANYSPTSCYHLTHRPAIVAYLHSQWYSFRQRGGYLLYIRRAFTLLIRFPENSVHHLFVVLWIAILPSQSCTLLLPHYAVSHSLLSYPLALRVSFLFYPSPRCLPRSPPPV